MKLTATSDSCMIFCFWNVQYFCVCLCEMFGVFRLICLALLVSRDAIYMHWLVAHCGLDFVIIRSSPKSIYFLSILIYYKNYKLQLCCCCCCCWLIELLQFDALLPIWSFYCFFFCFHSLFVICLVIFPCHQHSRYSVGWTLAGDDVSRWECSVGVHCIDVCCGRIDVCLVALIFFFWFFPRNRKKMLFCKDWCMSNPISLTEIRRKNIKYIRVLNWDSRLSSVH